MPAVSISALTDPVAIVHIPIDLADSVASTIYWTVDSAPGLSSEFFNVTSNAVEIAVFARTDLVNRYWADLADGQIKISSTWRVFEISSGDQGETTDYDSPHLRHVSAPLSKAGISILYQSSYFSDFLLVNESTFKRASQIFAEQGWHVDPCVATTRRRSQLLSPITPIFRSSPSPTVPPPIPVLTVLPSPLACIGFSHSIERATAERVRQLVVWPGMARSAWQRKRAQYLPNAAEDRSRPFVSYTRTVDGASLVTETRILRWMFGRKNHDRLGGDRGSEDETTGYESAMEGMEFQLGGQLAAGYTTDTTDLGDTEDEDDEASSATTLATSRSAGSAESAGTGPGRGIGTQQPRRRCTTPGPLDGFSLDQPGSPQTGLDGLQSLDGLQTPPPEDRRTKHLSLPTTPRDHRDSSIPQTIAIEWCNTSKSRRSTLSSLKSDRASPDQRWDWVKGLDASSRSCADHHTPGETDVGTEVRRRKDKIGRKRCLQLDLRGLEDTDETESSQDTIVPSGHPCASQGLQRSYGSHVSEGKSVSPLLESAGPAGQGEVYHMDKSGLVTTFSNLLNTGRIKMLYSSTFHTANILVEARDVHRARRLLEGRDQPNAGKSLGDEQRSGRGSGGSQPGSCHNRH